MTIKRVKIKETGELYNMEYHEDYSQWSLIEITENNPEITLTNNSIIDIGYIDENVDYKINLNGYKCLICNRIDKVPTIEIITEEIEGDTVPVTVFNYSKLDLSSANYLDNQGILIALTERYLEIIYNTTKKMWTFRNVYYGNL